MYLPLRRWIFLGLASIAALPAFSQVIPEVESRTLDGGAVALPPAEGPKPLLLMLGFSHKSWDDFQNWNHRFKAPPATDSRVQYFELVDLQGLPSVISRMVLHGMRRSVKEPERSHFAPFRTHEQEWKELVRYDDPKIAYLLLADSKGRVIWQTHGPATDENYAALEAELEKLPGRASPPEAIGQGK
jgi:hypothetical protein